MKSFIISLVISCAYALEQFQIQNGIDAKALDDAKASVIAGSSCTGTNVICVGDAVGRCENNIVALTTACSPGTSCQVLPLVNKPGTSVSCDTESDKLARFAASGVGSDNSSPVTGSAVNPPLVASVPAPASAPAPAPESNSAVTPATGANKAGDFVCIDDTKFKQFTSATDFVVNSCPPGFCFTRSPPLKNPCVGKENAIRIDGQANPGNSILPPISPAPAPAPASAPAPAPESNSAVTPATGANKAGDFVCIDDTKFKQFTSATDFVVNSCPPGFCFTRSPPLKNPCVGKENAIRIDTKAKRQLNSLSDIRIKNAQDAVKGNINKKNVKIGDSCSPEGVVKCINDQTVMCIGGIITGPIVPCPGLDKCSVLPNVNKAGTVERCNPESDTTSRINLGLKGSS